MAGLRYFPETPEAVSELIDAMATAPNADAAAQFTTRWLGANESVPTPAEIRGEFFAGAQLAEFKPVVEYRCAECSDTGFVIVERGGVSGARRCECRGVTTVQ
jgi:hypothetical protein